MLKWNFLENVSGNNGTLTSYMDLPLYTMYTLGFPNN